MYLVGRSFNKPGNDLCRHFVTIFELFNDPEAYWISVNGFGS